MWFKCYMTGSLNRSGSCWPVLLVALTPLMAMLPAMASLAVLAVLLVGLIGWETHRYAEERHRIRHAEGH